MQLLEVQTNLPSVMLKLVAYWSMNKKVLITVVLNGKTRPGGAFFPYLKNTIYGLDKYGIFKAVGRNNYKHNCLYLALQAGGLSDIKLQELLSTLRNRTFHKCVLSNVCNTLEINIEITPIRNDGKKVMLNTTPKVHTYIIRKI